MAQRQHVAHRLLQHLRTTYQCVPQLGTHTVRLPDLRRLLAIWLSTNGYLNLCPNGEIDQKLWHELQRQVEHSAPGYHLVNETTGAKRNGWTNVWMFTNDPELTSGQTRAELDATLQRFIRSLPRLTDGSGHPYAAGVFHIMGKAIHDMTFRMYEELPLMMREASNGTATWQTPFDAVNEVRTRAGIDGQNGYDIGQKLWAIFNQGGAASQPVIAAVP
jgi:hypothetical protein